MEELASLLGSSLLRNFLNYGKNCFIALAPDENFENIKIHFFYLSGQAPIARRLVLTDQDKRFLNNYHHFVDERQERLIQGILTEGKGSVKLTSSLRLPVL
jgi:hypothetical protein